MIQSDQNNLSHLRVTAQEGYSFGSIRKRYKAKSDWSVAIERLDEIFDPKTFASSVLSFSECKKLSEIMLDKNEEYTTIEKQQAKDLFVNSNLRLVRQISLGYLKKYSLTPIEDIFQMGVIGLIRAVEKWDPDREFLFSTYATWWIRQSITRAAMDNESIIRVPIHMQERIIKVVSYEEQYFDFFNIWPEPQEASDALEIGLDDYLKTKEAIYSFQSISEVSNRNGELRVFASKDHCLDESTAEPSILVQQDMLTEQLAAILSGITSREERIIKQRYGLVDGIPKTLDEIGKEFGVTRERIRQIEAKTMTKLRHPSRSMALRDFLDKEEFDREIHPSANEISFFRVGAEPLD